MNAAVFSAGILLGALIVVVAFGTNLMADPKPTEVGSLCAAYGGVDGNQWEKEKKTFAGKETYTVSVDCKDGSWVMRSYRK